MLRLYLHIDSSLHILYLVFYLVKLVLLKLSFTVSLI